MTRAPLRRDELNSLGGTGASLRPALTVNRLVEDDGFVSVKQDAIFDVPAHRAR